MPQTKLSSTVKTSRQNSTKVTQVHALLSGRLHVPMFVLHEAIGYEETGQHCSLNTLLLRIKYLLQALVEGGPELLSELLLIGEVASTVHVHCPNPEHGLEPPERHTKRTNIGIPPVAYASNGARVWVHVDVILQEVSVVGHEWPILIKDNRELGIRISNLA